MLLLDKTVNCECDCSLVFMQKLSYAWSSLSPFGNYDVLYLHTTLAGFLFVEQVWIFDQTDGSGRILHERNGHSEPPIKVRFHGTDGKTILSAGDGFGIMFQKMICFR